MGGGVTKPATEAVDVGDDEEFNPIHPDAVDRRSDVSGVQAEKLKRKSVQINEAMMRADKKEMSVHVSTLRKPPLVKVKAPTVVKGAYSLPVRYEGYLTQATPSGTFKRYYQLVGQYLVRYSDESATKGRAIFPTFVHGVETIVEGATDVSKEFIADMENRGSSFYVYTPTRTMTVYAPDLAAQKGWIQALTDAVHESYDDDEVTKKEKSLAAMKPLLLNQAQIQFARMQVILSNLRAAGFVAEAAKVKSKKKGYLEFQRVEYEDEQFYADLISDAKPEEAQFTKMYCVLRSDQTIVYGASEHEAKSDPEGIISLNHLHVVLDAEKIEKTGKMVFSLVTPLRTFVMKAAHQVALEEWLRAIIKVTAKLDDQGNAIETLSQLSGMDTVPEVDLPVVLDDDAGVEAYEHYIAASCAEQPAVQAIFTCWGLCKEYKDANEFEAAGPAHDEHMKKLEGKISEFLGGAGLPEDVGAETQAEFKTAVADGAPPPVSALRAACLAALHDKTYEGFKATDGYAEYVKEIKAAAAAGEPIPAGAKRVLIYTPNDPKALKARLAKMDHAKTKLKKVGADEAGEKMYEAWTTLKHKEDKVKSAMIGRDHKCDVAVDDDRKVSREHARIDCAEDGRVVFMDLGSSHGSKVNGKSVNGRVCLAVGDIIKVGKTKILFTIIPEGSEEPIR